MRELPGTLVATAGAYALTRWAGGRRTAVRSRWTRLNHAGEPVTLGEGPAVVLTAALGARGRVRIALLGAGAVGLLDDLAEPETREGRQAKGFRGHLGALRGGRVTTGMIKIAGVGVTALAVSSGRGPVDLVIDTALVAGTANLVNLLDLRPGRAAKVVGLAALALTGHGGGPLLGATLGALPADLAGRAMLGDCGANGLGAGVATAAVRVLPRPARLVLLAGVVALNLASERVSFTAVIDRTPALRWLDRLGRP